MAEELHDTIKKIKQSLRLSMNGIVSAHQRKSGLNYKINFGVEIPRLKSIAAEHTPDKNLALALWNENIRECKLLAIFLLPRECFEEIADKWVAQTTFTEIADHLTLTILRHKAAAKESAIKWMSNNEGLHRYCGYLTLTHLTRRGTTLTAEEEEKFFTLLIEFFSSEEENNILRRCAFASLCSYVDDSKEKSARFLALAEEGSTIRELFAENFQYQKTT